MDSVPVALLGQILNPVIEFIYQFKNYNYISKVLSALGMAGVHLLKINRIRLNLTKN